MRRRPDDHGLRFRLGVRGDISGHGTWAFVPARSSTGETGEQRRLCQNKMQDRSSRIATVTRLVFRRAGSR